MRNIDHITPSKKLVYDRNFDNPKESISSTALKTGLLQRVKPKSMINRNDICYCGSGLKYKHCCIGKEIKQGLRVSTSVIVFLIAAAVTFAFYIYLT